MVIQHKPGKKVEVAVPISHEYEQITEYLWLPQATRSREVEGRVDSQGRFEFYGPDGNVWLAALDTAGRFETYLAKDWKPEFLGSPCDTFPGDSSIDVSHGIQQP